LRLPVISHSPLSETVQEIYETLEEAFRSNASFDATFDTLSHAANSRCRPGP
jgi:hypothetical protein